LTIFVPVLCIYGPGLFLLPRLAMAQHGSAIPRLVLVSTKKFALYGWVPLRFGLLAWTISSGKMPAEGQGWFTRKLLTFSLAAGMHRCCPGGFRSDSLSAILRYDKPHQGVPVLMHGARLWWLQSFSALIPNRATICWGTDAREHRQHGNAAARANDDRRRLVADVLSLSNFPRNPRV